MMRRFEAVQIEKDKTKWQDAIGRQILVFPVYQHLKMWLRNLELELPGLFDFYYQHQNTWQTRDMMGLKNHVSESNIENLDGL